MGLYKMWETWLFAVQPDETATMTRLPDFLTINSPALMPDGIKLSTSARLMFVIPFLAKTAMNPSSELALCATD